MSTETMSLRDLTEEIQSEERILAPGSETALWGEYLECMRRELGVYPIDDTDQLDATIVPPEQVAWWRGAYRACAWAEDHGEEAMEWVMANMGGEVDWAVWKPLPTPDALKAWRKTEGLTQARAAELAGVDIRAWQRWEYGEREIPQWLPDVLTVRWGNAP